MKKYLTEFIGTFFLVLAVCLTGIAGHPMAPLPIGASLMVMVYMGGHVSGGHYNPAVSLAVMIRGKLGAADLVPYWISQLAGAVAAAAVANIIMGKPLDGPAPGKDSAGNIYPVHAALLVEILYTFALALVVLNVATSKKTEGNSFYGLAIGFTIAAAAFCGGGVSGGAYNPAVGLGPNIWNASAAGGSLLHVWLYVVGPLAGAAVAAVVFKLQEEEEPA